MQRMPNVKLELLTPVGLVSIATAGALDLSYVVREQQVRRKRVGWITRGGLADSIERGAVWVAKLNGQRAGYTLCSGGTRRPMVVRQVCVDEELWGNTLGQAWMQSILGYARLLEWDHVTVRTRLDIDAQVRVNLGCGGKHIACATWIGEHRVPVGVFTIPLRGGNDVRAFDVSRGKHGAVGGMIDASALPACGVRTIEAVRLPRSLSRVPHLRPFGTSAADAANKMKRLAAAGGTAAKGSRTKPLQPRP